MADGGTLVSRPSTALVADYLLGEPSRTRAGELHDAVEWSEAMLAEGFDRCPVHDFDLVSFREWCNARLEGRTPPTRVD